MANLKTWIPIVIAVIAGSIATALVPQTVPILGAIAKEFEVDRAHLGWIVSFPTLACALGALAFGVVVDRFGDVRLLLAGMVLVIIGDAGVSMAPHLQWLFAARLFQGIGYLCITVSGPTFIQRVCSGDTRRAAMALWAAHTPIGFAAAVYFAAQMLAAGFSWRWSFVGHAAAALIVGIGALSLLRIPTATNVSRSAGTARVLKSSKAYAVGAGALAAGMLQVSVMVMVPSILIEKFGFTGPQSAVAVVMAMIANWLGAMLIVATRVRHMPRIALPVSALAAALTGFLIVAGLVQGQEGTITMIMLFTATIGTANAIVWSMLPAAVPSPEASGATAGLVTQGSFIGVLFGPPIFFWMREENPMLVSILALILAAMMIAALRAHSDGQSAAGGH